MLPRYPTTHPPITIVALLVPSVIIGRVKGGIGIAGSVLSGFVTLVSFAIGLCLYLDFFPELGAFYAGGPVLFLFVLPVTGLMWGTLVSIALCSIINRTIPSQDPLTDDSCGPTVRHGQNDRQKPRSAGVMDDSLA